MDRRPQQHSRGPQALSSSAGDPLNFGQPANEQCLARGFNSAKVVSAFVMRIATKIRFALAAVIVTLLTIGVYMGFQHAQTLYPLVWLLVIDSSALTRPVPRNDQWTTIGMVVVFLAVAFALIFLHLAYPNASIWHVPSANSTTLRIIAALFWALSLWAIQRRWQEEKRKTI